MGALQYVDVPRYAAILFRRTYADLSKPGALMDRAQTWLHGTDARWNAQTHTWRFPSGAVLTFGHMEHEIDKEEYKSTEFQYIGFDELTDFTATQYTYMFSRLRRTEDLVVPLRMRAGTNPGGPGHKWVRQRFLIEGQKFGRPFLPATVLDNPHVDVAQYRLALAELDLVTREQLENGRWDVTEAGPMFNRDWFDTVDEAPADCRWVRYWDLAATKQLPGQEAKPWTAGVLLGEKAGVYYVKHVARTQGTPLEVEDLIGLTAEEDGVDVPICMEQEPGSAGVNTIDHYARVVLKGYAFAGDKKTGDKISMAKPISSAAQRRNVKLVRGDWNTEFLDEAHAFPQRGFAKDQIDALSGAQRVLTGPDELTDEETFVAQSSW